MNSRLRDFLATAELNWPLLTQLFRFGLVGLTAAFVHLSLVILLVQIQNSEPLLANIVGFAVAFQVSYWGNRLWTFDQVATFHRVTMSKLLLVQLVNFAANETLFYIFLSLHFPYPMALLIVLSILPVFTFLSSKMWVFK